MASLIPNQGLNVIAGRTSNTSDGFAAVQSMSVDDGTNVLAASSTTAQSAPSGGTAPTSNFVVKAIDSVTRSNQTVSHVATFGTADANFTIRRVLLHFAGSGSVSVSSATVFGGVDGQALQKTASFSLKITLDTVYSAVAGA